MKNHNYYKILIIIILSLIVLFCPVFIKSQDSIKTYCTIRGYVSNMQSFMFQEFKGNWLSDNLIHNRLNIRYLVSENFDFKVEIRNRFITGETVKIMPEYSQMIEEESGYFNLSKNITTGESFILNSKIDRLQLGLTIGKLQLTLGRQRINWGQCITWNPNDLFNTYFFFDFDYIEKPGCDAIRMQYYTSEASVIELAAKTDNDRNVTAAAMLRINKWNYDMQFLGGLYNNDDFVLGAGWSGNIKDAAFRGEINYYVPKNNFNIANSVLVLSIGSEYTFSNSITLQTEILYNKLKDSNITNFNNLYNLDFSAKKLSFSEYSILIGASKSITPLVNASLSGIYFTDIDGFYIGPAITFSLTSNIDFSILAQSFGGKLNNNDMQYFHSGFLRLKWNF